jgi:ABC-2 type transport system ATP-binding protein
MIIVKNLIFEYPTLRALDDVAFAIEPNTVTALIGPNGAGKTTLMRCIAALDVPLSGTIEVDGLDVERHPREVHARMGFLYDFYGLYDDLSVTQSLIHRAGAQGVPSDQRARRVARAAERLKLTEKLDQQVGALSRGWRQRLSIALNIVHEPKLLLLDEPASGLDPVARDDLSATLRELHKSGMTIMVSSHILSELEDYSTHVLAIDNGRISSFGPIGAAKTADGKLTLSLTLSEPCADLGDKLPAGVDLVSNEGAKCVLQAPDDPDQRRDLLKYLVGQDVPVAGMEVVAQSLRDSYLAQARDNNVEGQQNMDFNE